MGSTDMALRDLYLPADTDLNLAAATAAATELCEEASLDDLRTLLDNDWIPDADDIDWSDEMIAERADTLRQQAKQRLHRLLAAIAASLHARDVLRTRLDPANPGRGAGLDAYLTGGITIEQCPTTSYGAWDLLFDTDLLPPYWSDRLGAAAGLLHPAGGGPVAAMVAFYRWSPGLVSVPTVAGPDDDTTPPGPHTRAATGPVAAGPAAVTSRPPTMQERILAAATDVGCRAGCQVTIQPEWANTGSVYFTPGRTFTPRVTVSYRFHDGYCGLHFTGPGIGALAVRAPQRHGGGQHPVPVPGPTGRELTFHHLTYVDGERIERMLTLLGEALDDPTAPPSQ